MFLRTYLVAKRCIWTGTKKQTPRIRLASGSFNSGTHSDLSGEGSGCEQFAYRGWHTVLWRVFASDTRVEILACKRV